jgi:hypothetical protein
MASNLLHIKNLDKILSGFGGYLISMNIYFLERGIVLISEREIMPTYRCKIPLIFQEYM